MDTHAVTPRLIFGTAMGALLATCAMLPSAGHAQAGRALPAIEGRATGDAPESRVEAAQAIDAALAAALIGAVSAQFDERGVEVRLDRVRSDPVNLVDMAVEGAGRLRLGGQGEWLPVRVSGIYDSVALSVEQPRITIGDDLPGDAVAMGTPLARSLQQLANERLRREFAQQPADLALDRVVRSAAGQHYARIDATGTARFDEGATPVTVQGLYDTRSGRWVRIAYELAGSTAAGLPDAQGVAAASP